MELTLGKPSRVFVNTHFVGESYVTEHEYHREGYWIHVFFRDDRPFKVLFHGLDLPFEINTLKAFGLSTTEPDVRRETTFWWEDLGGLGQALMSKVATGENKINFWVSFKPHMEHRKESK